MANFSAVCPMRMFINHCIGESLALLGNLGRDPLMPGILQVGKVTPKFPLKTQVIFSQVDGFRNGQIVTFTLNSKTSNRIRKIDRNFYGRKCLNFDEQLILMQMTKRFKIFHPFIIVDLSPKSKSSNEILYHWKSLNALNRQFNPLWKISEKQ